MAASFMNPHRAIEYLFNPDLMPVQAPPAQQQQPPTQPQSQTTAPTSEGGNTTQPASRNLDFLRNSPQVNQSYASQFSLTCSFYATLASYIHGAMVCTL